MHEKRRTSELFSDVIRSGSSRRTKYRGRTRQVRNCAAPADQSSAVTVGQADTIKAAPMLLPLADNGGPTRTHALAAGSPAIDAGNNLAGLVTDQRGSPFVRVAGAAPDIGAFELQPATTGSVSIGPV
jgi:hypothetical protein